MLKPIVFIQKFDAITKTYGMLFLASVLVALIPTIWSSLDLKFATLFFSDSKASSWWWVEILNRYTPSVFRGLVLVCSALWLATRLNSRWEKWHLPLAFVAVAGIAGPGLAVNGIVKPIWERARPLQISEFGGVQQFTPAVKLAEECSNDCSFVSGHAACGFFFCSLCLIFRRHAKAWIITGIIAGTAIGFGRMSSMAHWLSDVLWAFPVTLLSSWIVWWAIFRFRRS